MMVHVHSSKRARQNAQHRSTTVLYAIRIIVCMQVPGVLLYSWIGW
jgi:hypothetical protein